MPGLFARGEAADGAGRTGLAAEDATRLAEADAGDDDRSPQLFETAFKEGGMEGVRSADADAFAAADAAGQEVGFVAGSARAEEVFVRAGAEERDEGGSGGEAGEGAAAAELGGVDECFGGAGRGAETEGEAGIGAIGDAVEAEVTLGATPLRAGDGVVGALAMEEAAVAVAAAVGALVEAEEGPAGGGSEEGSEGAEDAAPESCDSEVEKEDGEQEAEGEEAAAGREGAGEEGDRVERGEEGGAEGGGEKAG